MTEARLQTTIIKYIESLHNTWTVKIIPIGYKAKLDDSFMSKDDICFLGKVLEHMDEDGDLTIEEEIY